MRFVDWLNLFRSPRKVARGNIRIRRREYLRFSGPVAVVERYEDRCVLAAPEANGGGASVHMNSMLMSSVSVFDADLDLLTVSVVGDASHGSLLLNSDGAFVYTPNLNFVGEDSFSFQAQDGTEGSNVASFAITVGNSAPTAINGSDEWHMNSWAWGTLAASDPDFDWLTFSVVTEPEHGSLLLNSDGYFSYTPHANYVGADAFEFQVSDGAAVSNVATFAITLGNLAPTAIGGSVVLHMNSMAMSQVYASDPESDWLTFSVVTEPEQGSLMLNSDGYYSYTPDPNYVGTDAFQFRVSDGAALSNVATVVLSFHNDAPTAYDGSASLDENSMLFSSVSVSDIDLDPLSVMVVGGTAHGSLTLNADGSFLYMPDTGYVGFDEFWFEVSDGQAVSNLAFFTITVNPLPPPPLPQVRIQGGGPKLELETGATSAMFSVWLDQIATSDVTVEWTVTGTGVHTADSGDFLTMTGSAMILAGTISTLLDVQITGDHDVEPDETFTVTISQPSGATLDATTTASGTILNDDFVLNGALTPILTLTSFPTSVTEGSSGSTTMWPYTLSLSAPSATTVNVPWMITHLTTNAADFASASSGTFLITPGMTAMPLSLLINADSLVELDETFMFQLQSPTGATLGTPSSTTVTIENDDSGGTGGGPSVSIGDVTVTEGNGGSTTATFDITLSSPSTSTVTVNWSTADNTATTADLDYASASGIVSFAPTVTSQTVTVTITGDTTDEPDESFFVNLSSPNHATLGDAQGIGTITSDDSGGGGGGGPLVTVETVSGYTTSSELVMLLPDPIQFKFQRSPSFPSDPDLTVTFSIAGTAAPSDYTLSSNITFNSVTGQFSVTIPAGDASVIAEVNATPDLLPEPAETVTFDLIDGPDYDIPTFTALMGASATGNITDATGGGGGGDGGGGRNSANFYVGGRFIDYDEVGSHGMLIDGFLYDTNSYASGNIAIEFDFDSQDGTETIDDSFQIFGLPITNFKRDIGGLYLPGILMRATELTPSATVPFSSADILDQTDWQMVPIMRLEKELATEVDDDPKAPGNNTLVDSDTDLEQFVQQKIDQAVTQVQGMTNLTDEQKRQKLVELVYFSLGKNQQFSGIFIKGREFGQLTKVEYRLEAHLTGNKINRLAVAQSIYRDVRSADNAFLGWTIFHPAVRDHTLGSTIKSNGVLVGTDKWGHFFQQGYWLYQAEVTDKDSQGNPMAANEAERTEISRWWEGFKDAIGKPKNPDIQAFTTKYYGLLPLDQFGIFGEYSTGVQSNADVIANEAGYKFYKALFNAPLGTYQFKARDHVAPSWNEKTTPNKNDPWIDKYIRPHIG